MEDDNIDWDDIDTSGTPFINTLWIIKPLSEILTKISMVLPVVVFGLFGNLLVIYVLAKYQYVRTPTNLLIGNMALADLLSILIHPWVILTYDFFQSYQLGKIGCKGEASLECSVLITSVISMSAITYDRLTAIVLPTDTRLTKNGARIVMIVTWVIGALLSFPLCLARTYKERQWLDYLEKYCTENLVVTNMYWYVIITVIVWLPLSIQITCYITIFIKLNNYEKIVAKKMPNRQMNYKKKAAQMMFVVTLTFMICRLPFTALIVYRNQMIKQNKNIGTSYNIRNQVEGMFHTLWFVSKYLIFLNTAINPIIYGATNEKFRRAFKSTTILKWLFPTSSEKAVIKPIDNQKTSQESSSKYVIFLIFKRKPKPVQIKTPATKRTALNTNCNL